MRIELEKLLSAGSRMGASEVEVYATSTLSTEVTAKKNSIDQAVLEEVTRIGVRVAVGKRVGAAGGVVSGQGDAEKLLEKALSIARTAREDEYWPGFNSEYGKSVPEPQVYDEVAASLTAEDLVGLLQEQISLVTAREGVQMAEGGVASRTVLSVYANTHGAQLEGRSTIFGYMLELKSRVGGGEGTFYDYVYKAKYSRETVEETTRNAVEMVVKAAEAKPSETVKGDLILLQEEAASIIDALVSPAISAEQAGQRRSPLAGKIGERVLSSQISMVDDPFLPWELGSASWDDEGHPTSRKPVFEDGVFKTFLYDYYWASREGRASTGNAARQTPWSKPSPAPTNLVVTVGGLKGGLDELVGGVERGVVVVRTIGGWMSNPVSGQINATINFGFLVEKGSIMRPVKGLVIADNIYEVLGGRFAGASGPVECRGRVCSPAIMAREVAFSGKG